MPLSKNFVSPEPSRAEVDALVGSWMLEFGTSWCGHCLGAQPHIAQAFEEHPQVSHLKIEDGRGRPLGRSFRVTLWPTLIFIKDGEEVARLVRPQRADTISRAMRQITG